VVEVCVDTQIPGEFRCRFVQSMGSANDTLLYGPDNLWVPKTLAERLCPVAAGWLWVAADDARSIPVLPVCASMASLGLAAEP
jgi:hypothetical protein